MRPGDRPSSTAAGAIARPQVRREAVRPRHAFNYSVLHWRFVAVEPYVLQGTFKKGARPLVVSVLLGGGSVA